MHMHKHTWREQMQNHTCFVTCNYWQNPRHTKKDVLCPPPETLAPEISSLLPDWWQNAATRQLTSQLKERKGEEIERSGGMLYSSLSLGVCVCLARRHLLDRRTTAPNPSVSKARGRTSRSDRTRIPLETQHCDHNRGTEHKKNTLSRQKGWM